MYSTLSCCIPLSQISEGVQNRAVPPVRAAQMHTTQAFFLLPLALPEPAAPQANPQTGRDLQLQPRCLLYQIWWGNRHLPRWRWVSATEMSVLYKTASRHVCIHYHEPLNTPIHLTWISGSSVKGKCYGWLTVRHLCKAHSVSLFEVGLLCIKVAYVERISWSFVRNSIDHLAGIQSIVSVSSLTSVSLLHLYSEWHGIHGKGPFSIVKVRGVVIEDTLYSQLWVKLNTVEEWCLMHNH